MKSNEVKCEKVSCQVKFDVKSDDFLRAIFFRRQKSCVKKLNILRVVPITTLLHQTADLFYFIF